MTDSHVSLIVMATIGTSCHMEKLPQGICNQKLLAVRCETKMGSDEFIPMGSIDNNSNNCFL